MLGRKDEDPVYCWCIERKEVLASSSVNVSTPTHIHTHKKMKETEKNPSMGWGKRVLVLRVLKCVSEKEDREYNTCRTYILLSDCQRKD